jgi:E3 ubiquitin-protein ligase NEDD4
MVHVVYKHLLGWPISFNDLQAQDEIYYESLRCLSEMDDVSSMSLDFTVTEEIMGLRTEVELVKGGAMRYRILDRTKLQLTELLLGFFDVIPVSALTVFDPNELELILCGLSEIDMVDWQANTKYSGIYSGTSAKVVEWFWQVVEKDFDQEMRARLLQFVTGTSGVPSRGFSVLQGIDGNIKKFTIHGVEKSEQVLPRSHTCFNRIDLPNYSTKKELRYQLKTAVTMGAVGFGMR